MDACVASSTAACSAPSGPLSLLVSTLLSTITSAPSTITPPYPEDEGGLLASGDEFDWVVVGSGSAGAVIASRLSALGSVLLLEAGDDPPVESEVPALVFTLQHSPADWGFNTEPHPGQCLANSEGRCQWARGKVLGGCSTINAMMYVRGAPQDYDGWNIPGWSFAEVDPFFQKSIDPADPAHLTVGRFDTGPATDGLKEILMRAAEEIGYRRLEKLDGTQGFGVAGATIRNGTRCNTARAFLIPVKDRRNLHVAKRSHVTKVLIDQKTKRATGVRLVRDGEVKEVLARREVVLSAGAIGSPQLLQLSGVGPAALLNTHNVPVVADISVGHNLQDHLMLPAVMLSLPAGEPLNVLDATYDFLMHRRGLLSNIGVTDLMGFVSSKAAQIAHGEQYPDIQFHLLMLPVNSTMLTGSLLSAFGYKEEVANQWMQLIQERNVLIISPTLLRPKSRGKVEIQSSDPTAHPRITPDYLSHPDDMQTLVEGVQIALKLLGTETLRVIGGRPEFVSLSGCPTPDAESRAYWECAIRHLAVTVYHPLGSCPLGTVLDERLRVRGVTGLRVADASVMPLAVSGNTHAASIMIGEKAAAMLAEDMDA